jgi:lipopolysaccharide transport system permease protein
MLKLNEKVATYEPDNSIKKGYLQIFGEILTELRNNKWLIYQLFRRDFLSMYRQSVFGILWAFIIPLVSVGAFVVLNQSGVFITGDIEVNYVVYALLGLAFWQLFSTGLIASSGSMVQAGSMISKINFSKKALVISSMGKTLIAFVIQLVLAALSFAVYGVLPNIAIILIPVLVIPIVLITLGLGFVLSILNGVARDVGNLLPILTTFLLFLTPVMYAVPKTGILGELTVYNPLYYLVSVPRDLVLTGTTTLWFGFSISVALSIIVFVFCLVAFHLTETRLAERI